MTCTRNLARVGLCLLTLALLAGCKTAPKSTRLTTDDLLEASDRMAQSLAVSDFLRERAPDSPPIFITINKVENLTTDLIPLAEQWMVMARLQGQLPIQALGKQRNIRFLIPPERHATLRDAGYREPLPTGQAPTHTMSAVFRSSTRVVREKDEGVVKRRQEYYLLQFAITDLKSGQLQWTDSFEFKREAKGLAID